MIGARSKVLLAALLLLVTGCAAAEENVNPTTGMDDAHPIALQLYTVREAGSLEDQLRLASGAGYTAVETLGTHGMSAREVADLAQANGLSIISTHTYLGVLRNDLDQLIEEAGIMGNDVIVLPILIGDERPADGAGWRELGSELDGIGRQLREAGLALAYHNHDFEMTEYEGQIALDHLFSQADPQNLKWQADLAWVARGGQDPLELLERHSGRVISIHAKDNAPEGENQDQGGFADVGYGVLDWNELLPASLAAGAQWFIVEHDHPVDEERAVIRSREFLVDWFDGQP